MAQTKHIPCKYFRAGYCKKRDRCEYNHKRKKTLVKAAAVDEICSVCREPINKRTVCLMLFCMHSFCSTCIHDWSNTCRTEKNSFSCPLCRKGERYIVVPVFPKNRQKAFDLFEDSLLHMFKASEQNMVANPALRSVAKYLSQYKPDDFYQREALAYKLGLFFKESSYFLVESFEAMEYQPLTAALWKRLYAALAVAYVKADISLCEDIASVMHVLYDKQKPMTDVYSEVESFMVKHPRLAPKFKPILNGPHAETRSYPFLIHSGILVSAFLTSKKNGFTTSCTDPATGT
ncbi:hypothetical protein CANCADRAFT_42405 [Tortispora caseinolytica NRRL Y-17796]|uniref:RING-type E3 ubiquitin transferase n=1 Tax=Tortispora caseinolytica NRRL Y-17796 TaxID=767744 RepID=A0A1E4TJ55_9ASCO|nr:hypothetical protein CANCADRAFT_42405 [Tortispora caseinolytica NRRL Y-17796]